ncbi:MAG TPA: alpha amylase C-terminal domain-containing protein [Candidatus Angelobacter sp.]|nr:alpha amylase C-terminal domain-containing protein [Candidatus Angelobacter sp.]
MAVAPLAPVPAISQLNISASTPMGANLCPGGAIFRVWAPRAKAVYLNGTFGGAPRNGPDPDLLLQNSNGYWSGFLPAVADGDTYNFLVVGNGSTGPKRDPYAREMAIDKPFPECSCVVRDSSAYPWHDAAFVTPDYSNMIIYQLHVGAYDPTSNSKPSTFLDVVEKIEYLAALGINVLQPLPIYEMESGVSEGYNGGDFFSPDLPYMERDAAALNVHLATINRLLAARGFPPLASAEIATAPAQLKVLVDLCHLHGIAVVFDVVYNHAGGFFGDDHAIYFWDRATNGDNNQSLYCTDKGWAGGLAFALWNQDVRQFLINNARFFLNEFHADGFRYDEISVLLNQGGDSGAGFCRDLTGTLRFEHPRSLQNAEHWPPAADVVSSSSNGGFGFDVVQHDALRIAIRSAISQSSYGATATVNLDAIAAALFPPGMDHAWRAVTCIENHDVVKQGNEQRIPPMADANNQRTWYARSRTRVANSLLLTAPGIPQLFMGQEFLEDKQWHWDLDQHLLIWWDGVNGADHAMVNHLRFTQDLIRLRWRQPALRSDSVRAFHVHNTNRVIAYHRWIEGQGRDVVVVASLNENTWWNYNIGFPSGGRWLEVFNSDVYDNWANPIVAGNGGAIDANGSPAHGFPTSANIVIPANGVVVFAPYQGN